MNPLEPDVGNEIDGKLSSPPCPVETSLYALTIGPWTTVPVMLASILLAAKSPPWYWAS